MPTIGTSANCSVDEKFLPQGGERSERAMTSDTLAAIPGKDACAARLTDTTLPAGLTSDEEMVRFMVTADGIRLIADTGATPPPGKCPARRTGCSR